MLNHKLSQMLKVIGNDKSNDHLIDILKFNNLLVNKINGYSKQVYYLFFFFCNFIINTTLFNFF